MPEKDEIVAMAVAAIAEEIKTDAKKIRVVSFKEVHKTGLAKYLAENNIEYKKFTL